MIFESVVLFLTGFISMFFATFFGGGALIEIPVLLYFGLSPAGAVATNRLAIWFQSIGRVPDLNGKLNIGIKIPFIITAVHTIGAVLGALILISIDPALLFRLIGAFIILAAILIHFSSAGLKEKTKQEISRFSILLTSVINFVVGIFRGFFGPGAGIIIRIVSVNLLGLSFIQSIALANIMAFFASLAALIVFLNAGLVNFDFGIPLSLGAFAGGIIGTRFAILKGNLFIKNIFVFAAIVLGVYFLLK